MAVRSPITRGLLVKKEPLEKILSGRKTWEIRGRATTLRGRIALIESRSGHIVGTCDVVGVVGPLTLPELRRNARRAGFAPSALRYRRTYAWILKKARRLSHPVPYRHPPGAVTWVRLDLDVVDELAEAARPRFHRHG
jgi:hypothetical protein